MKCRLCNRTDIKSRKLQLCSICYAKDYRKKNKEKIKKYLERTKERRRKFGQEYYGRNRLRINKYCRDWKKRNKGYTCNTEQKRKDELIKRKTRAKYPLKGHKCEFCNHKAEQRHHTTKPMKIDEFSFVCRYHHEKIHGKKCRISKESVGR